MHQQHQESARDNQRIKGPEDLVSRLLYRNILLKHLHSAIVNWHAKQDIQDAGHPP